MWTWKKVIYSFSTVKVLCMRYMLYFYVVCNIISEKMVSFDINYLLSRKRILLTFHESLVMSMSIKKKEAYIVIL